MSINQVVGRRDLDWLRNNSESTKLGKPFYFIQAADCQLGMIERYIKKIKDFGWTEEIELCEKLVAAVNQMDPKPKFMVICGDLADAYPGWPQRPIQVQDLKRTLAKLHPDIQLVCVCGNHDVMDKPTTESLTQYKKDFGDDYFYFVLEGVLFIVINSQFYENREFVEDYAKEQDHWIESILDQCKNFKHSIVFQHIPWFLRAPDEEDEYFNIAKSIRLHWLNKFRQAGVSKIMCGHYHRNAGGYYESMEVIVTSAIGAQLGDEQSGYRIVKVSDDSIKHRYFDIDKSPNQLLDIVFDG